MGYTTEFRGKFTVDREVDDETFKLLRGLAETRRMRRGGLDAQYGLDGEFYIDPQGDFGQSDKPLEGTIVDSNKPPRSQPSLWCQWTIEEDRKTICWDGGEKFYYYVEWIKYLINSILAPKDYKVNGSVQWRGEEFGDDGIIVVVDNKVTINRGELI